MREPYKQKILLYCACLKYNNVEEGHLLFFPPKEMSVVISKNVTFQITQQMKNDKELYSLRQKYVTPISLGVENVQATISFLCNLEQLTNSEIVLIES